ncbi:hypothetical protein ACU6U9_02780 [Pseudomonas sp. HK3]
MPSPGTAAIESAIAGTTFQVEGTDTTTEFKAGSILVVQLSKAIDAGWTSISPALTTSMVLSFALEFTNLVGPGLAAMNAIASGIDQETALWVASYNPLTGLHAYAPTAVSLKTKIIAASPIKSNGMNALADAITNAFIDGFDPKLG